jgi:Ca2+-binding RTX toxin-like protein
MRAPLSRLLLRLSSRFLSPRTPPRPKLPRRPLNLEGLEQRSLLAGGVHAALHANGLLHIVGTPRGDAIRVRQSEGVLQVVGVGNFAADRVRRIEIAALGGNDNIDLKARPGDAAIAKATRILAGAGNDRVQGGQGGDFIYGGRGNDVLFGNGGGDRLFGQAGTDRLMGGGARDWLEAGSAAEYATGGWNAHRWSFGGVGPSDVDQQGSPTCSILAAMASATRRGIDLSRHVTYRGNYTYRVRLFDPHSGAWTARDVRFNGAMVRRSTGRVVDPKAQTEGEYWTVLIQRAYLMLRGVNPMNGNQVAAFGGDDVMSTLRIVTGRRTTWRRVSQSMPQDLQRALAGGAAVTAGTSWSAWDPYVVGGHAYMVDSVNKVGSGWVVRLYNPWGTDGPNVQGANDGYLAVSWGTFRATFEEWAAAHRV